MIMLSALGSITVYKDEEATLVTVGMMAERRSPSADYSSQLNDLSDLTRHCAGSSVGEVQQEYTAITYGQIRKK